MNNLPFFIAGWVISGIDGVFIWFIKDAPYPHPFAYAAAAAFTYISLHLLVYSAINKK